MEKEGRELHKVLDALDRALAGAVNPPPGFEQLAEAAAGTPTGIDDNAMERARQEVKARVLGQESVGALLRYRREVLDLDVEPLARRTGWNPDDIESLERDDLDLQRVEPGRLGILLFGLGLIGVGPIEAALRKLVSAHLASYAGSPGPVYGRSRRGVGSYERRRGLTSGIAPVDVSATNRAADAFVREVDSKLRELAS